MTITPYGQITPDHIARSDQDLAKWHQRASQLDKAIAVAIYPDPDDRCGLEGCDDSAAIVIACLYGKPERVDVPLCEPHFDGGKALQPILTWAMEIRGFTAEAGAEFQELTPAE